jgi:transposase
MIIIGCDYHPGFQQIAFVDTETGELQERRLQHREEAEKFYRDLAAQGMKVRVGMEASGHARWFERLLAELNFELWIGDAAEIRTKRVRKQKTDRQDAQLILKLMLEDRFPQIWVPSWENRDLRQLLWHRHRLVQSRTRIMNQLQAVALNEGLRCKKRLWREAGRRQLEGFQLAPWASQRRRDLLELLDRLDPTIAQLTQAIEQEVAKCPEARRLQTHPGVGPLTALAFVLIIGRADRFQCGKQIASYLGLVPLEESSGDRRRLGHITKQGNSLLRFLLVEAAQVTVRSLPEWRSKYFHLAMRRGRKIAKVAMARKLAVRLYWMMRKEWDYEQLKKFGSHAGQPGNTVVRHPIYTGILTGFLGMAIAISQVRGFIAFVLVFLALWIKLCIEEQWMRSQFGEAYATYAYRTAALVPYLL